MEGSRARKNARRRANKAKRTTLINEVEKKVEKKSHVTVSPSSKKKHGWALFMVSTIWNARLAKPYDYENDTGGLLTRAEQDFIFELFHYDEAVQQRYADLCLKELYLDKKDRHACNLLLANSVRHDICPNPQTEKLYQNYLSGGVAIMFNTLNPKDYPTYKYEDDLVDSEQNGYEVPTKAIMIGHLCDYIKPELKACLKSKKCTYNVTKDNFIRQTAYHCITCHFDIEHHSICQSCMLICHKDHLVIQLPGFLNNYAIPNYSSKAQESKAHIYCDCGANLPGQRSCQCL